ncbi:MAG: putative sugar nucleotidyl transferase [Balneolaceae bacterium]
MSTQADTLCLFEDEHCALFKPLTLTRPLDDLRLGILTLREKWNLDLRPDRFRRITSPSLRKLFPDDGQFGKEVLWINSRLLPNRSLLESIRSLEEGHYLAAGPDVVAARTTAAMSQQWEKTGIDTDSLKRVGTVDPSNLLDTLWSLLAKNEEEIRHDIERWSGSYQVLDTRKFDGVHQTGDHPVCIQEGVEIEPGVVFVTIEGPIWIGEGASIEANSVIRGTAAIGDNSIVRPGSLICPGTTIGPVCKVAGEIHNSIFHSFSNKAHEGFTGDSIFGQWVNLGAGTTTSNLKNNYQSVTVVDYHTRRPVNTNLRFLGTVMGDHSRTAIGTRLNTGTIVGVSSNLFTPGFPEKLVPSFRWVGKGVDTVYKLEKALETMKVVMDRRNKELTEDYKELMQTLFDQETADSL